jgi:hypothetical protein
MLLSDTDSYMAPAGSQQYTAMNLKFNNCLTAVQMVWDWGFNWQRVEVDGGAIAFNISGRGGDTGQGIGSVSIIGMSLIYCIVCIVCACQSLTELYMQTPGYPIAPLAS